MRAIFDQDNQGLTLAGRGEAFGLASNPALLSVVNGASSATATVSWTPNSSQARTAPYVIGLRVSENYGNMVFQSDVSVSLKVGVGVTGVNENLNDAQLSLSPNPAADQFNIQFVSKSNSDVAIDVMTVDGKSAAQFVNTEIAAGLNVIQVNNLHLAKGIYIVRLNQDGKFLGMQRLVIQ